MSRVAQQATQTHTFPCRTRNQTSISYQNYCIQDESRILWSGVMSRHRCIHGLNIHQQYKQLTYIETKWKE